jgi:hypothetical protein
VPYRWLDEVLARLNGIEPYEVSQALSSERRMPVAAANMGINCLGILARTHAGRPLAVVVRGEGGFDWRIIGVRDMTIAELAAFEAWEVTR